MKKISESKLFLVIVTVVLSITGSIIADSMIASNTISYENSKTNETTVNGALNELFSAVDINKRLGNTDEISIIGNGTVSGAISTLNTGKQATITGAASTIASSNLAASRALISNGSGKVEVSAVTSTELGYLDGVTSNVQTQLNGKQATIAGGASTIASSNLTANRALISNGSGKVAVSGVTSTELGYIDGVTSNVQTQINNVNNSISNLIKNTTCTLPSTLNQWTEICNIGSGKKIISVMVTRSDLGFGTSYQSLYSTSVAVAVNSAGAIHAFVESDFWASKKIVIYYI